MKNRFALILLAGFSIFLFQVLLQHSTPSGLNPTAAYYAGSAASETGAANVVTSIVVTYRGLDTLGEVTVLFLTALIIGFLLKRVGPAGKRERSTMEILTTSARVLIPGSVILGVYVFLNGHLTPGGGFQGGAIIGTAIALMILAEPVRAIPKAVLHWMETSAGVFYVLIGLAGLVFAGGFLDNRILPLGRLGELFSAGAIPVIYSLIGIKVGAELSSIIAGINETETKALKQ
jgi:multicomponent Na+:H+ antiporter subunit B